MAGHQKDHAADQLLDLNLSKDKKVTSRGSVLLIDSDHYLCRMIANLFFLSLALKPESS